MCFFPPCQYNEDMLGFLFEIFKMELGVNCKIQPVVTLDLSDLLL